MQMNTNGKMPPGERRPAVGEDVIERRARQHRIGDEHADDEQSDGADLEEARQVIARTEQQPHRQHRGDEAVAAQGQDRLLLGQREIRFQGEPGIQLPATTAASVSDRADQRRLDDAALADPVHVQADEQRDRDGAGDGEGAPGTAGDDLDAASPAVSTTSAGRLRLRAVVVGRPADRAPGTVRERDGPRIAGRRVANRAAGGKASRIGALCCRCSGLQSSSLGKLDLHPFAQLRPPRRRAP